MKLLLYSSWTSSLLPSLRGIPKWKFATVSRTRTAARFVRADRAGVGDVRPEHVRRGRAAVGVVLTVRTVAPDRRRVRARR